MPSSGELSYYILLLTNSHIHEFLIKQFQALGKLLPLPSLPPLPESFQNEWLQLIILITSNNRAVSFQLKTHDYFKLRALARVNFSGSFSLQQCRQKRQK